MLGALLSLFVAALTIGVFAALIVDRYKSRVLAPEAAGRRAAPVALASGLTAGRRLLLKRRQLAAMFAAGVVLLAAGQIGLNGGDAAVAAVLCWLAGLAALVLVERRVQAVPLRQGAIPIQRAGAGLAKWRAGLLVAVALASLYIWGEAPDRSVDDSSLDIVLLWVLSIIALIGASGAVGNLPRRDILMTNLEKHRAEIGLAFAVLVVSAVPRLYNLSSYAWSMSGDEGTFAVTARSTLEVQMRNPFNSGPWGYPSLLFIIQGWFIDLLGGSVGSARALSALFGIGSVLACYALVRYHFDRYAALTAGLFVSVLSFHVYWSRDAQNASAPMFFIPLALLLLDRGIVEGRRASVMSAGLTIAAAQYFHPANRLLLPMALAYVVYALLLRAWELREISLRTWGPTLTNSLWLAAAIVVGHLPLMAYFETYRTEFWARTDEVSVFASGWLEREQGITGDSAITIMSRQLWHAIMMPFSTVPHGHFRPGSPLVGWPLVAFVALGCALATVWWFRRPYFGLALAFWVTTIGLAFTEGPPMTNRYTPAAPILAVLGALGLVAIAGMAVSALSVPRRGVLIAGSVVAVFIAAWHLEFYFHDPNQVDLYSDFNSQVANVVAREAEDLGVGATVYLSGLPRMYYYGFMNIEFIAPNATGIDVDPMWSSHQSPPGLTGQTLFVFVPERMAELDIVRSWFPNGSLTEHFLPSGEFLCASYLVDPDGPAASGSTGK